MNKQLPIATYGMDVLTKQTMPVKEITLELIKKIENMFFTMHEADGIGLAAPQVGINSSFLVIDVSFLKEYSDIKPLIMINPEIIDKSGEWISEEGCLSIPGIRVEVPRAEKIYVKYWDANMKEIELEADKLLGRVIQHEVDHVNGKLFLDYITDEQKKEIKKELDKIKKGKVEAPYPLIINKDKFIY